MGLFSCFRKPKKQAGEAAASKAPVTQPAQAHNNPNGHASGHKRASPSPTNSDSIPTAYATANGTATDAHSPSKPGIIAHHSAATAVRDPHGTHTATHTSTPASSTERHPAPSLMTDILAADSHPGTRSASLASSVYYDCETFSDYDPADWPAVESDVHDLHEPVTLAAAPTAQQRAAQQAVSTSGQQPGQQQLPGRQQGGADAATAKLARIMQGLQQGTAMCLTCSKLWSYKKAQGISLEQLEQQLRALPAAEPTEELQLQRQQQRQEQRQQQQQQHKQHQQQGTLLPQRSATGPASLQSSKEQQQRKQQRSVTLQTAGSSQEEEQAAPAPAAGPRTIDDVMVNLRALEGALHAVHSMEGWHQVSQGALQLYFRQEGSNAGVKGCCVLHEPVETCVATAREADLLLLWNSLYSDSDILHKLSPSEFIVFQCVWLPWPLTPPGALVNCQGFDVIDEEGAVVIACNSITTDQLPPGARHPNPKGKRDIVTTRNNVFYFAPLPPDPATGEPRTAACAVCNLQGANLQMASALLRVFAPLVFVVVKRTLRKLFNPHAKDKASVAMRARMASEPGVYGHIAKHVEAYVHTELAQQRQAAFKASGRHPDA